MSNQWPDDNWQAGGHDRERAPTPGSRYGNGFGQPATDSQQLRDFGSAYEEHLRQTVSLATYREREPRSLGSPWPLLLGLVLFVLLLVIAMGMAVLLAHPR
jgi:hypothetical protein